MQNKSLHLLPVRLGDTINTFDCSYMSSLKALKTNLKLGGEMHKISSLASSQSERLGTNRKKEARRVFPKSLEHRTMNAIDVLTNELLDEIFTYIDSDSALYPCLLVNHRFNAHATPFIYRSLRLPEGSKVVPLVRKIKLAEVATVSLGNATTSSTARNTYKEPVR